MDMSYDKKCGGVLFCINATGPITSVHAASWLCEDVALHLEAVKGVTPYSWVSALRVNTHLVAYAYKCKTPVRN